MYTVAKPLILSICATVLVACSSSSTDTSTEPVVPGTLNVVSWGGAYERSQIEALYKPWSASTGNSVNSITDSVPDISDIEAQITAGNVTWDIVDVELPLVEDACERGLLEVIDSNTLTPAPDGTAATNDFYEGTLFRCGVASIVWSNMISYNTDLVSTTPDSIADFFDLTNFPGKRGMRKSPQVTLEMALIADGVVPDNVYRELGTNAGIERAFAKLDEIKSEIVWWDSGAQSIDQMSDGNLTMTTTYNGRAFTASRLEGKPFETIWDGQVWDIDLWVIPKGAPNRNLAFDFLKFATESEQLANQASYLPYGPTRRSSQSLVGTHHELGIDMQSELPTAPQNFQNSLRMNTEFWSANAEAITERFSTWLDE